MLNDVLRSAHHALELLLDRAASVDPALALLGVVLYILAQAVRTRGWHTIIRAAYPDATGLRARHTMAAYLAGAGLNGVIPARGGGGPRPHRRPPRAGGRHRQALVGAPPDPRRALPDAGRDVRARDAVRDG